MFLRPQHIFMSQFSSGSLFLWIPWDLGAQQFEGNLNLQESRPQKMLALNEESDECVSNDAAICLRYCMMATDQEPRM